MQVGNLSFYTTEEQIYELFSQCANPEEGGGIKRIIMGLDRNTRCVPPTRMNFLNMLMLFAEPLADSALLSITLTPRHWLAFDTSAERNSTNVSSGATSTSDTRKDGSSDEAKVEDRCVYYTYARHMPNFHDVSR